MYSHVLKGMISASTAVLLVLIVMYHAREIQVGGCRIKFTHAFDLETVHS